MRNRSDAPRHRPAPGVLAFAFPAPKTRTRTTGIDALVFGVCSYSRAAGLPEFEVLNRCWHWLGMTERATKSSLGRLTELGAIHIDGYQVRVVRSFSQLGRRRGARYRIPAWALDKLRTRKLSELQVRLIGLLPGRTAPGREPWADSIEFLTDILGAGRSRVREAISGLRSKRLVELAGTFTTARGATLNAWSVSVPDDDATGPVDDATGPVAVRDGTTTLTLLQRDPCTFGSSAALPREPGPASPDQSAGCAGDDPIDAQPSQKENQNPGAATDVVRVAAIPAFELHRRRQPSWFEVDAMEVAGAAALSSWPLWWTSLREAVGRVHNAGAGDVDGWFVLLTLAGVLLIGKATKAGRLSLRDARRELAADCARRQGPPSIGAEWLFLEAQRIQLSGGCPRQVAAAFRVAVTPKPQDYIERSNARVAKGLSPLPMSCELTLLARPGHRLVGTFAYPTSWALMDAATIRRIDAIKDLIANVLKAWKAREIGGQVAVARFTRDSQISLLKERLADQVRRRRPANMIGDTIDRLDRFGIDRAEIRRIALVGCSITRNQCTVSGS